MATSISRDWRCYWLFTRIWNLLQQLIEQALQCINEITRNVNNIKPNVYWKWPNFLAILTDMLSRLLRAILPLHLVFLRGVVILFWIYSPFFICYTIHLISYVLENMSGFYWTIMCEFLFILKFKIDTACTLNFINPSTSMIFNKRIWKICKQWCCHLF